MFVNNPKIPEITYQESNETANSLEATSKLKKQIRKNKQISSPSAKHVMKGRDPPASIVFCFSTLSIRTECILSEIVIVVFINYKVYSLCCNLEKHIDNMIRN